MITITPQKIKSQKLVTMPLTLEQIAFSLRQLSHIELELLEELIDKKFQKTILSRARKNGQTTSLYELQQEFGK